MLAIKPKCTYIVYVTASCSSGSLPANERAPFTWALGAWTKVPATDVREGPSGWVALYLGTWHCRLQLDSAPWCCRAYLGIHIVLLPERPLVVLNIVAVSHALWTHFTCKYTAGGKCSRLQVQYPLAQPSLPLFDTQFARLTDGPPRATGSPTAFGFTRKHDKNHPRPNSLDLAYFAAVSSQIHPAGALHNSQQTLGHVMR
jgi:hypothetical protein